MNNINYKVNKIYKTEEVNKKFNKFLATDKVNQFVNDINNCGLHNLIIKYNLQYLYKYSISDSIIMNYIRSKIPQPVHNIINYTGIGNNKFIKRIPEPMSKKEMFEIEKKRLANKKLKYAERMHMLEKHKINKWEIKHRPTKEQLKNDLFPTTIIEAFENLKEKKLESIRLRLCEKYPDPVNKIVKLRYYDFENGIEKIKEKIIGIIKDPKNIIDKRTGFYYIRDSNDEHIKKIFKQIVNIRDKIKEKLKDDYICLKIMTASNRVGCWV